jgi:hypothetical protein
MRQGGITVWTLDYFTQAEGLRDSLADTGKPS